MVSHLLFANDCFLFCRAKVNEVQSLLSILRQYEKASGQQVNLAKSEVFFSNNLSQAAKQDLANILGVKHALGTGMYLGLPSMVGRSKKATFTYIKDKIWRKINSWRGRSLSKAGKETMIKSVFQSIPSYIMSIYLIPQSIVNDIERMLNSFWWGEGTQNKGIRWLAWDRLTCSKSRGGMGFWDLKAFNTTMLAKQGWKLLRNPESLMARVLKARYFPNSSFLHFKLGHNPSYSWRSIWSSHHILLHGCRWRVGDGSNIRVMNDPWVRGEGSRWFNLHKFRKFIISELLT